MEKSALSTRATSGATAPTQLLRVDGHSYAYRRFGSGVRMTVAVPAALYRDTRQLGSVVTDPLASGREVILFDNAGIGRSTGVIPETVAGMAEHVLTFLDGLRSRDMRRPRFLARRHDRPTNGPGPSVDYSSHDPRRYGSARWRRHHASREAEPRKASSKIRRIADMRSCKNSSSRQPPTSQAAGGAFIARLMQRTADLDAPSGPNVAKAQMAAFREWECFSGERFADLREHITSHAGRAGLS